MSNKGYALLSLKRAETGGIGRSKSTVNAHELRKVDVINGNNLVGDDSRK